MVLTIEQYSDKAIVVRGDTQPYKEDLKNIGGKWNSALKGGGGWIFPNIKRSNVEELNSLITSGSVKGVKVEIKEKNITHQEYLALVTRLEKLEQIVSQVDFIKNSTIPLNIQLVDEDDDDEKEESKPVQRLLKNFKK